MRAWLENGLRQIEQLTVMKRAKHQVNRKFCVRRKCGNPESIFAIHITIFVDDKAIDAIRLEDGRHRSFRVGASRGDTIDSAENNDRDIGKWRAIGLRNLALE